MKMIKFEPSILTENERLSKYNFPQDREVAPPVTEIPSLLRGGTESKWLDITIND